MNRLLTTLAAGSLGALAIPASAADIVPSSATPALSVAGLDAGASTSVEVAYDRDRRDRRYRSGRGLYDRQGRYYEPRRIRTRNQMWRGDDGRYYCRRDNGTTGLVIGAGVGALAGHEVAGRGDKTLGAILGGALGAVIGREIDRGSLSCR